MHKKYEGGIPDKGFTHGGKFHSDDVFATAFLRILNPRIQIARGFEAPEDFSGIVYDIGRGEFDHHQQDKEYRENGCPYAAFGLIWRVFGADFVGEEEAARFDEEFIQPLDRSDNTGCENVLATIIDEFNPSWDAGKDYEPRFWKAVDLAETILRNHFQRIESVQRGQIIVEQEMMKSDGRILVLSVYAPWKKTVIGSGYRFVVYPSNRGGYSVQGVPKSSDSQELLCSFPAAWRGKDARELPKISGIPSLRFCHPSGFLAAAGSLEDALTAAEYALAAAGQEG